MFTKHLAVAVALTTLPVAANAATINATEVTLFPGAGVSAARSVGSNAFGEADNSFLSLGLGGAAVFGFGQAFTGPVTVQEVTFGARPSHFETARVFVSNTFVPGSGTFDESSFTEVAQVTNVSGVVTFDVAGSYRFLAFLDTSPVFAGRDGFDIDSISASSVPEDSNFPVVPLPATGLLLLGSLAALSAARRTRRSV